MKLVLLLFIASLSAFGQGHITIYNDSDVADFQILGSSYEALSPLIHINGGDSATFPLPSGFAYVLHQQTDNTVPFPNPEQAEFTVHYLDGVGFGEVTFEPLSEPDPLTIFLLGSGVACMFYSFGWSMRLTKAIGGSGHFGGASD